MSYTGPDDPEGSAVENLDKAFDWIRGARSFDLVVVNKKDGSISELECVLPTDRARLAEHRFHRRCSSACCPSSGEEDSDDPAWIAARDQHRARAFDLLREAGAFSLQVVDRRDGWVSGLDGGNGGYRESDSLEAYLAREVLRDSLEAYLARKLCDPLSCPLCNPPAEPFPTEE